MLYAHQLINYPTYVNLYTMFCQVTNSSYFHITFYQAMHTAAGPWGRRLTSLIVTVRKLSHHLKQSRHQSLIPSSCSGVLLWYLHHIPYHHWRSGACLVFEFQYIFNPLIFFWQFDRAFASLIGPEFCHIWYLNRDFIMPATR